MNTRFFEDIPMIEWNELDGRTLAIEVITEGAYKVLYGYDSSEDVLYVLSEKMIK